MRHLKKQLSAPQRSLLYWRTSASRKTNESEIRGARDTTERKKRDMRPLLSPFRRSPLMHLPFYVPLWSLCGGRISKDEAFPWMPYRDSTKNTFIDSCIWELKWQLHLRTKIIFDIATMEKALYHNFLNCPPCIPRERFECTRCQRTRDQGHYPRLFIPICHHANR